MTHNAVARYQAQLDARADQDLRLFGPESSDRWARGASRFRRDPRRENDPDLAVLRPYVAAEDVVVDVGGGAGRFGLPLALACREVINVEPSPGMGTEFEAIRAEAAITNARLINADWLAAETILGDVTLIAHVTYFVRDIEPFVQKLVAASRRRVMVLVDSVPPPNRGAEVFRLLFQEERERVPGFQELLPVLWDMGIIPEVRLTPGQQIRFTTREEAVTSALRMAGDAKIDQERARSLIEERFDDLLAPTPEGYTWRTSLNAPGLLITWQVNGSSADVAKA